MKTIIPVAMTLLLAFSAQSSDPEITLVEKPKTTFKLDGKQGRVEIAANRERVPLGEEFSVRISFANLGDEPLPALDPMLTGVAGRYVRLLLFNAEGESVVDLLLQTASPRQVRWPSHTSWCEIPPRENYVIRRRFTANSNPTGQHGTSIHSGRYYIQLIVNARFVSDSSWDLPYYNCGIDKASRGYAEFLLSLQEVYRERQKLSDQAQEQALEERFNEWRQKNPASELVRSNVVTIEFVAPPVEAPKLKR